MARKSKSVYSPVMITLIVIAHMLLGLNGGSDNSTTPSKASVNRHRLSKVPSSEVEIIKAEYAVGNKTEMANCNEPVKAEPVKASHAACMGSDQVMTTYKRRLEIYDVTIARAHQTFVHVHKRLLTASINIGSVVASENGTHIYAYDRSPALVRVDKSLNETTTIPLPDIVKEGRGELILAMDKSWLVAVMIHGGKNKSVFVWKDEKLRTKQQSLPNGTRSIVCVALRGNQLIVGFKTNCSAGRSSCHNMIGSIEFDNGIIGDNWSWQVKSMGTFVMLPNSDLLLSSHKKMSKRRSSNKNEADGNMMLYNISSEGKPEGHKVEMKDHKYEILCCLSHQVCLSQTRARELHLIKLL